MRENQPSTNDEQRLDSLYSIVGEPMELYNRTTDPLPADNILARHTRVAAEFHQQL